MDAETTASAAKTTPMAAETRTIRILAMGPIGSGKSTFISAAADKGYVTPVIGHGAESCTRNCTIYLSRYTLGSTPTRIELVDSPGFEDPERKDMDILKEIAGLVRGIAGIIYFHRVTDSRLEGDRKFNLEIIKAMCGRAFFSRIVICSTMWDTVTDASVPGHTERMEKLLRDPAAFGDIMEAGAVYEEFWGDGNDPCLAVLRHFANQRNAPRMAIMAQLEKNKRDLLATEAAHVIEDDEKNKKARLESLRKQGTGKHGGVEGEKERSRGFVATAFSSWTGGSHRSGGSGRANDNFW